jgi:hypothetical protein
MARGIDNPRVGAERGRAEGTWLVGDFVATIDDLDACVASLDHAARLGGRITFAGVAEGAPIADGALQLYVGDRETGMKQMRYRAAFTGTDGARYRLEATKFIRPGRATIREQVTAYARLFREPPSSDGAPGEAADRSVVAAGVLVFRLRDLPGFLWSMRAEGATRVQGLRRFLGFSRHELATPVPVLAS